MRIRYYKKRETQVQKQKGVKKNMHDDDDDNKNDNRSEIAAIIIKQNWRNVHPTIAHGSGLDWRLLSMDRKTHGDIEAEVDPKYKCLKAITYVSLAKLQPSLSYDPHSHNDHEEIYYIIKGHGLIKIGDETSEFRDGDVIYIPNNKVHTIINDGDEMIEFLAFGGYIHGDDSTAATQSKSAQ